MANEFKIVGKGIPLVDGRAKVTGTAKFAGDIDMPGMLHAKILRSPHAHAKITNIDTSKAEALPGVRAALTYKNVPQEFLKGRDIYAPIDMILLENRVRFVGDEVAAIAADTEEIAEEALDLIEVEYELLPSVLTIEDAEKTNAPLVHPKFGSNYFSGWGGTTGTVATSSHGDVEQGFLDADVIVEQEYRTSNQPATSMEPRACVAWWDAEGTLQIRNGGQSPYRHRDPTAKLLGLPLSKVRVVQEYTGGTFGNKGQMHKLPPLTGLLAKQANRPVKLKYSRADETMCRLRHEMRVKDRIGVKNDGTITAMSTIVASDAGAYSSWSGGILMSTGGVLHSWSCQNTSFEGYCVYTNNPVSGAYRGFGSPQGYWAAHQLLHEAQERIGMDPIEFSLKNHVNVGDGYQGLTHGGLRECIEKVSESADWENKWKGFAQPVESDGPRRRGIGQGMLSAGGGSGDTCNATVHFAEDGSVNLLVGVVDNGAGQKTMAVQCCAEALGFSSVDRIQIYPSDSAKGGYAPASGGDKVTHDGGWGCMQVGLKAKAELLQLAAAKLGVGAEELDAEDGEVYIIANPAEKVSFGALVPKGLTVSYTGNTTPPSGGGTAQISVVDVDIETGGVTVIRQDSALCCGKAINMLNVEGQACGAAAQGIGYAISEELIIDQTTGFSLNPTYENLLVPTMLDVGEEVPIIVEDPAPSGPYGAHGCGNPPIELSAPSIGAAIYNATGVRILTLPMTPDKILKALGKVV